MTRKLKIILISGLLTISSISAQATMMSKQKGSDNIIIEGPIESVFDPYDTYDVIDIVY